MALSDLERRALEALRMSSRPLVEADRVFLTSLRAAGAPTAEELAHINGLLGESTFGADGLAEVHRRYPELREKG